MFNLFKKKNNIVLLGTLSLYDMKKVRSDFPILSTDWEKIQQGLKDMETGKVTNLNFQISDGINLDKSPEGNLILIFCPKTFLQTGESPYYELLENGQKAVSMETVRKAVEYFFNNQKRNEELDWETK